MTGGNLSGCSYFIVNSCKNKIRTSSAIVNQFECIIEYKNLRNVCNVFCT